MTQPFQFSNGQLAHDANDLLQLCQEFPDDGTNYLVQADIEKWLTYIGKDDIAECAAVARQTAALEDRQKLTEFLNNCHAMSSPEDEMTVADNPSSSRAEEALKPSQGSSNDNLENHPGRLEKLAEQPIAMVDKSETSAEPRISAQSTSDATGDRKPSFFKVIAKLVVNVLYRNKE